MVTRVNQEPSDSQQRPYWGKPKDKPGHHVRINRLGSQEEQAYLGLSSAKDQGRGPELTGSSWACGHGVPEMNLKFSWVLLFLQPEGFWSLWWLFRGSEKVGMVLCSALFASPQTRQLWVSSLYSNVLTSFKCRLIWWKRTLSSTEFLSLRRSWKMSYFYCLLCNANAVLVIIVSDHTIL